jgi:hypothetical protein
VKNVIKIVPVKGFESYSVDEKGNVFNRYGKRLRPELSRNGYLCVSLSNKSLKHKKFLIHRLVAEAFIPNPENRQQVNHKDQDRTNNKVDNLEWVTPLENLNYSNVIEKASIANQKKIMCITTGVIYDSFKAVKEELGLSHSNLVACCNGRRKTCGGLKWKYLN